MNGKKSLLDQLAFFQTLNMSKAALRKQLRTHGYVEITMHDGVVLTVNNFSQAFKCIRWNFKKASGMSYRVWKRST